MLKYPNESENFLVYACLPFVKLAHETNIQLGPVLFWPASKYKEFLTDELQPLFQVYIQTICQIKVTNQEEEGRSVHTRTLVPEEITCISIEKDIPIEWRELILIDSLYLFYFACTFRSLYYGQEIPSFNAFRKMIPASSDFINLKSNWENLSIKEASYEEIISLSVGDPAICQGLGKALKGIYNNNNQTSDEKELLHAYKRLVRSIRYLVDRFFQRFVNLFDKGLNFSEEIFEPEDIIFLASSFETLFDINDKQPEADFKHKLRPLLHLKYSRPVEIFWKWVDDFYELKRRIVRGEPHLNPLFCLNPNFEISHIFLGIKLFIYSVCYHLFKFKLISTEQINHYTPPDFKCIHPEEILLFFWTEPALLRKLSLLIKQIEHYETVKEEVVEDMHLLTHLFVSIYERYGVRQQVQGQGFVRFIPTSLTDLYVMGSPIIHQLKEMQRMNSNKRILQAIHPDFIQALEERLKRK